jgi:hypothetical protein
LRTRILLLLVGLLCALVLTSTTASAHDGVPTKKIVFTVQNLGFTGCDDGLFALTFDLVAPAGRKLGDGVSCVHVPSDCPPVAGCRGVVQATFTLTFARGSLIAPVALHELWLSESTILQVTQGKITSGTGVFAGATGSIGCVGTVRFAGTDVIPKIVCVVRVARR